MTRKSRVYRHKTPLNCSLFSQGNALVMTRKPRINRHKMHLSPSDDVSIQSMFYNPNSIYGVPILED